MGRLHRVRPRRTGTQPRVRTQSLQAGTRIAEARITDDSRPGLSRYPHGSRPGRPLAGSLQLGSKVHCSPHAAALLSRASSRAKGKAK
jgi:hypothetical protein